MKSPTLLVCIALATSTMAAPAESGWPNWRGPNADGTSSDAKPPLEWSATKNVRWKTPIPGRGSSSPVVFDN